VYAQPFLNPVDIDGDGEADVWAAPGQPIIIHTSKPKDSEEETEDEESTGCSEDCDCMHNQKDTQEELRRARRALKKKSHDERMEDKNEYDWDDDSEYFDEDDFLAFFEDEHHVATPEEKEEFQALMDTFIEIIEEAVSDPETLEYLVNEEFDLFDVNSDGILDKKEVRGMVDDLYEELGLEGEVDGDFLDIKLKDLDTDADGEVSRGEFRTFYKAFLEDTIKELKTARDNPEWYI